jgi:hypothetical protein
LNLEATSEGAWGKHLWVGVDYTGLVGNVGADVAARYGLPQADLFNLTIAEFLTAQDRTAKKANRIERFASLSGASNAGARRVDRVLAEQSNLVEVPADAQGNPQLPATRPTATPAIGSDAPNPPTPPAGAQPPMADPALGANLATGGSDGDKLQPGDYTGDQAKLSGLYALDKADLFNLLCIPNDVRDGDGNADTDPSVWQAAYAYCAKRRAFLIVDPPSGWGANVQTAVSKVTDPTHGLSSLGLVGDEARNAAVYFPRVIEPDPMRSNQANTFVPCGIVAGVMARTDVSRGVWKAPAGLDAGLIGVQSLQVDLNDASSTRWASTASATSAFPEE